MSIKNKVQLIGNLGSDVETTTLENGNTVAKFSLATNETFTKKDGEKVTKTEWHNIVTWNKTAEIASKYLKKGDQIAVNGKLQTTSWEKDGTKFYRTEIVANEILMFGGGSNQEQAEPQED